MKVKIICSDNFELIYDLDTNTWNRDIDFEHIIYHCNDIKIPKDPNKVNTNIVSFSLGMSCNFDCDYCIQKASKLFPDKPLDIEKFKQTVENLYKKVNIRDQLSIWGGEPFVYWKSLQKILPIIRSYFPDVRMFITTNGSLLDKKKINFLLKYHINLQISHDGPSQVIYRKQDPFKDPKVVESIRYGLDNGLSISLHPVITKYNCDLIELMKYFDNIAPGMFVSTEGIVISGKFNDIDTFTQHQKQTLIRTYTELMQTKNEKYNGLKRIGRYVVNKGYIPFSGCSCDTDKAMNLTPNGDLIRCHNEATNILYGMGNINRKFDNSTQTKQKAFIGVKDRPMCTNCWARNWCAGGCGTVDNDQINNNFCDNKKLECICGLSALVKCNFDKDYIRLEVIE